MSDHDDTSSPMAAVEDELESLRWQDLVSEAETRQLARSLSDLMGTAVVITSEKPGDAACAPVRHQLETIAFVGGDLPADRLKALARTVERVLYQASRYYLAANLHLDVVQKNYEALEEKHAALQASERQYRELSQQLENRVQEQVAQIEDRQRRLYASEKLNAVGRLGAGVAHEINNPIGFIQSNLNTAKEYLNDMSALKTRLKSLSGGVELATDLDLDFVLEDFGQLTEESLDGAHRIGRIVSDLRGFAGTDDTGAKALVVPELLESVWAVARPRLESQITLRWKLDEDLPRIHGDRAGLSQAFYNILENSAGASDEPVHVWIAVSRREDCVQIKIIDNGPGMDDATVTRVFEPFFTTKPVGSGIGLGLTVCRDTVVSHGGQIQVRSTPGKGTQVCVELPAMDEP